MSPISMYLVTCPVISFQYFRSVHKDKLEYDFMISEGVGYILTAAE